MPQKIIIIRHGQTAENKKRVLQGHLDTVLDEDGKKQALEAAELLKGEVIDAFFSSDLRRAYHTAKAVISKHNGKKIYTTRLLREKYFGKFQGMTFKEIGDYLPKFGEQGNFSFRGKEKEFGVETDEEVKGRIREFKKFFLLIKEKRLPYFHTEEQFAVCLKCLEYHSTLSAKCICKMPPPWCLSKRGRRMFLRNKNYFI